MIEMAPIKRPSRIFVGDNPYHKFYLFWPSGCDNGASYIESDEPLKKCECVDGKREC